MTGLFGNKDWILMVSQPRILEPECIGMLIKMGRDREKDISHQKRFRLILSAACSSLSGCMAVYIGPPAV